ncbi:SMP-30/gluconolactonase/LRE family protein [Methylobacterium sp. J-068]|uniref:SMP-30/gluconolactonase/LRE family protein n=1 Tax=Methylobacterium sp. J-068 TaxID=2836649 RepID=UPI001FBBAAF3|nr:SMP-30/gluconolactonase/LRE family protein [Methylobacterium sp. J-068]MCJ2033877.1 SMP-30/gluconolactonase/LRE family protein [Methylobacterium sp. J-068]
MTPPKAVQILDAPRCHLGEGPCYDPRTGTAWWVDILERRLFTAELTANRVRSHDLPFLASAVFAVDESRQVLAAEDGLYLRGIAEGGLARLCPLEAEDGGTRSNDGRVHPCGALWISTMGRQAEAGRGAIYHVAGTRVTRLYAGLTIPNAICFSPEGGTGYFADTDAGLLKRVPLDPATGLPTGEPATLYDHRGGAGGLDGAAVDAEGRIWCARWGAACIDAYSPEGARLHTVPVPMTRPSCPTFAGPRLDRLLVTSAYEGMTREERAADPMHGRTVLIDLDLRGLLEPAFRLGA